MKLLRTLASISSAFAISMSTASALIVDDFDSYAAGSTLASNGYTQFGGGASIVYPDAGSGLVPPAFPPLQGTQSVYLSSQFDGRGWGAASVAVGDGMTLSWLVRDEIDASTGQTQFYLSNNAGIGGGGSLAGILLDHATEEIRLTGLTETATGFSFLAPNTYKFEMVVDFTAATFDAYFTDVTGAGSRTLLGTGKAFTPVTAAAMAADGGVLLGAAGSAASFDDIQLIAVPEPASIALLALSGLFLLRGSRRRESLS